MKCYERNISSYNIVHPNNIVIHNSEGIKITNSFYINTRTTEVVKMTNS